MKSVLNKLSLIAIIVFALSPYGVNADAQESIQRFVVSLEVSAEGSVDIRETIYYDFSGNERRGVFRDIPTKYWLEDESRSFYETELNLESVYRDYQESKFSVEDRDGYTRIIIGDVDSAPVSRGVEIFQVGYSLVPSVYRYEGSDILQLDILGDVWDVPVGEFLGSFQLPSEPLSIDCFAGASGSREQSCEVIQEEGGLGGLVQASNLSSGEGVTLYVEFTSGSFTNYMDRQEEPFPWLEALIGLLALTTLVGSLSGIAWAHIRYRIRKRRQLVITRYEPPEGMSPGDVGLLNNNTTNEVEFSATLIDLASRGYITIEYGEKKVFFRTKQKYTFHRRNPGSDDELRDYERELLNALFYKGSPVDLEDVDKTEMQKALKEMHEDIKDRLVEQGYYEKPPKWVKNFKNATWMSVVMAVIYFINPFLLIAVALVVVGYASWRGVFTLASRKTRKGYTGWAHIEGFKEFLMMTEAERMDFHEAPERTPEEFSKFLPYAIALGVEDKWAKQFESMTLPPQSWVAGGSGAVVANAAFISGLSGGLNSFAKSSYSGGGGFSGGGGVGGGAGGGGGGSF